MRGYSGTAIKASAIALAAALGLVGIAACQRPSSTLSDPAKFNTAIHALKTDVKKVRRDFWREKRDAIHGPRGRGESGACYNLKNNVNFVVLKTIRDFVQRTVTADRNNVQRDINHIRHDRSDFQKDLDDFLNDGVARPSGARHAIEQITARIIFARSTANDNIRRINHVVSSAYRLGNAVAAEAAECAGDGPGSQVPSIKQIN
jgi:hypothetical protein